METELTDNGLFQLIAEGNESAFAGLFHRYNKRIYPFVLKMVKNTSVAEEITQEIFIKLWNNREKLALIDHPEAYIFTISSRHTLDQIKKGLTENKMLSRLAATLQGGANNNAAENLEMRDSAAFINRAINSLPPQQKMVYQLSRIEGLKYDEIASELNISPNTVRNHLVKALQAIRDSLKANDQLLILITACSGFMIKY